MTASVHPPGVQVKSARLSLYLRSPAYRAFVKQVRQGGIIPQSIHEYFGYGMYVGRK